jgi:hypothetical protein
MKGLSKPMETSSPVRAVMPITTGSGAVLARILAAASLIWFAVLIGWTLAGIPVIGMFSDSVWYLSIADYYRSLPGADVPGHAQTAYDTSRFPPLYPLLIAGIGGGIEQQDVVNHLSLGLTAIAGLAVVMWVRTLGAPTMLALAALPVTYLTPALRDWLLVPLSEPLFLACLAATLVAAHRARQGALDVTVVAALVSILPLVRSAGIVMLAAFALWLLHVRHASRLRRLLAAIMAATPAILWATYRSTKPVYLDYGNDVSLARMIEEGGTLSGYAVTQVTALVQGLQSWVGVSGWSAASVLVAILGVAACHGWWLRIREWQLDALFVPPYIGMLLTWPYPLEMPRLLSVIMPLIAAWTLVGVSRWIKRTGQPVKTPTAPGILLVAVAGTLLALPEWTAMVQRASLPADAQLEPYKRTPAYFLASEDTVALTGLETSTRILAVIEEAASLVPSGECVFTTQPALVTAVSRGRLRVRPTPPIDNAQPLAPQLAGCRYLIVMQLGSRQAHAAPLYPLHEVRAATEPVLVSRQGESSGDAIAGALLIRTAN